MFKNNNEMIFAKAKKAYQELLKYYQNIFMLFKCHEKQLETNGVLKQMMKFISAELKKESELKLPFRALAIAYQNNTDFSDEVKKFNKEAVNIKNKLNSILVFVMFFKRENLSFELREFIGIKYKDQFLRLYRPYLLAVANKDNKAKQLNKITTKLNDIIDTLRKLAIVTHKNLSVTAEEKIKLVKELISVVKSKQSNEETVELFLKYFIPEKGEVPPQQKDILPGLEDFFTKSMLEKVAEKFGLDCDHILCLLVIYYKCICKEKRLTEENLQAETKYMEEEVNYSKNIRPTILKILLYLKEVIIKSESFSEAEKEQIKNLKTHRGSFKDLKELMPKEETQKLKKSMEVKEFSVSENNSVATIQEKKEINEAPHQSENSKNNKIKRQYSRFSFYINSLNESQTQENVSDKKDTSKEVEEDKGADKETDFGFS